MSAPFDGFLSKGREMVAPDGTCLFKPGDATQAFFIITQGCVRVEQTNSAGRTMVLYRVFAGDSCVLTTSCMLSGEPYSGYGYAEGETRVVAIPGAQFQSLLDEDAGFRAAVFSRFATRVGELTNVIDELLVHRTDLRLARWLTDRESATVRMTHQEIAQEIGTVREVVSRTLKAFEKQGWVKMLRNAVDVTDKDALQALWREHL